MVSARDWLITNASAYDSMGDAVRDCMRSVGVSKKTVQNELSLLRKTGAINAKNETGKKQSGKIAGAINVDEHINKTDPKNIVVSALADIDPNTVVPDAAMFAYVREVFPGITREKWAVVRKLECFAKHQHRVGGAVKFWGSAAAVAKLTEAQYKYL